MLRLYVFLLAFGFALGQNCVDGPYGGNSGSPWSDEEYYEFGQITRVSIRHGNRIDQLKLQYGSVIADGHGSEGGSLSEFTLEPGEYITYVEGRADSRVDQLKFETNFGNTKGPFGGNGGGLFQLRGYRLMYLSGRSGEEVDQISFHWSDSTCPGGTRVDTIYFQKNNK